MPRDHGAGALNSDQFYAQGKRGVAQRPGRPGADVNAKVFIVFLFEYAVAATPPGAAEGGFAFRCLCFCLHKGEDTGFGGLGVDRESPFSRVFGDNVEHKLEFAWPVCLGRAF